MKKPKRMKDKGLNKSRDVELALKKNEDEHMIEEECQRKNGRKEGNQAWYVVCRGRYYKFVDENRLSKEFFCFIFIVLIIFNKACV